jgi:hypothetical protein
VSCSKTTVLLNDLIEVKITLKYKWISDGFLSGGLTSSVKSEMRVWLFNKNIARDLLPLFTQLLLLKDVSS